MIIGNGGAAISAVRAIRSINFNDEITIVSKENCLSYSPSLTPYYLSGNISYKDMFICNKSFYLQNKVNTFLGRKVVKVDTSLKRVYLDRGKSLRYDDLLIASGSSPIIPSIEGMSPKDIFTFYTIEDVKKVINFLKEKKSVAIIGAGLIGIHILDALQTKKKKIFLVEMMDQILPQVIDIQGARILEERLRKKGVETYLNETVVGIIKRKDKKIISLSSRKELKVDAIILAVGVSPNTDFLEDSGIELIRGVRIDRHCRTNIEGIYAAGDVAEAQDPLTENYKINATWPNAIEQGKVAGLNMAGKVVSILRNLRFNAFSLFGFPCISLGLIRADGIKLEEIVSQDGAIYRKIFFKDGLLIGAVLLGETENAGIIASLIERRILFPKLYETLLGRKAFIQSINEHYWLMTHKIDLIDRSD